MNRNLALLTVPPIIALALLFFFNAQEHQQEHTESAATNTAQDSTKSQTLSQTAQTTHITPKANLTLQNSMADSNNQQTVDSEQQPALSAIEQIRAIKEKTALHQAILKDHETFTRYPSQNVRFERLDRDPVAMIYETHERTTQSEDRTASITAWTDQKYILQGDSINIHARVDDTNQTGINNELISAVYANEQVSLGTFELKDTNQDGTYSLQLTSEQTQNWPIGIYKVLIASSHKQLSETVSFVISPPAIQLTGEYQERITPEGNLLFEIEVETLEAARYYVRASLYATGNAPIGSAEFSDNLNAGKHWVPLTYFGLMIHDGNEPGPYFIQTVELAKAGIPMLRMPPAQANFYTDSYTLEQFNSQSYREQQALK